MAVGIELLDSKSVVIFITLETGVRLVWFPDHQYGTYINTRSSLWLAIPTCILIIALNRDCLHTDMAAFSVHTTDYGGVCIVENCQVLRAMEIQFRLQTFVQFNKVSITEKVHYEKLHSNITRHTD